VMSPCGSERDWDEGATGDCEGSDSICLRKVLIFDSISDWRSASSVYGYYRLETVYESGYECDIEDIPCKGLHVSKYPVEEYAV
jgi:hypothetical protein